MKKVIEIVGYGIKTRVIGKDGDLPWELLLSDKIHFKKTTEYHIVISGSKSYESIPDKYRPLENRFNIVLSRNPDYVPSQANDQTMVCRSLEEAISIAQAMDYGNKIFIIGGGEIYSQALQSFAFTVDEIIASEIEGDFEGDTFFPEIDLSEWIRTEIRTVLAEPGKNSHAFTIVSYNRKLILP